jgi:hypothetical protein
MFFVGSAPLAADGHVNISPKGMAGTFLVLGPHRVAYLDYFASGVETVAHVRENGRIVLMWCEFGRPPKIVRLHGRGRVLFPQDAGFADVRHQFPKERTQAQRSIIVVDVDRVSDSCGYAVPLFDFVAHRDVLDRVQSQRDPSYYETVAPARNEFSIDGLPGITPK